LLKIVESWDGLGNPLRGPSIRGQVRAAECRAGLARGLEPQSLYTRKELGNDLPGFGPLDGLIPKLLLGELVARDTCGIVLAQ
jgi:hypothetical protein